jgi:hypothetical protein
MAVTKMVLCMTKMIRMGVNSRSKSLCKLNSWDSVMGLFGRKKKDESMEGANLKDADLGLG